MNVLRIFYSIRRVTMLDDDFDEPHLDPDELNDLNENVNIEWDEVF